MKLVKSRAQQPLQSFQNQHLSLETASLGNKLGRENVHTIINLEDRISLTIEELKAQIERIDRRRESYRIIIEKPSLIIARIDRVHRLMIQHHTYKAFRSGALVKVGSECELVLLPHRDGQVLVHARRMRTRGRTDGAHLIELVREIGTVAGGGEGMFRVGNIFGDPRRKAAFETTILDNAVDIQGGAGSARRGGCLGRW